MLPWTSGAEPNGYYKTLLYPLQPLTVVPSFLTLFPGRSATGWSSWVSGCSFSVSSSSAAPELWVFVCQSSILTPLSNRNLLPYVLRKPIISKSVALLFFLGSRFVIPTGICVQGWPTGISDTPRTELTLPTDPLPLFYNFYVKVTTIHPVDQATDLAATHASSHSLSTQVRPPLQCNITDLSLYLHFTASTSFRPVTLPATQSFS